MLPNLFHVGYAQARTRVSPSSRWTLWSQVPSSRRVTHRKRAKEQAIQIEKMAVFAPMTRASDNIATTVTTGEAVSERIANRRSRQTSSIKRTPRASRYLL